MKRILVAIDTSPRAADVLATAATLAERLGAKLFLFHAVGVPHEVPREAFSLSPDALVDFLDQQGKAYAERMAKAVPAGVAVETIVENGVGWRAICGAADRLDADLIVVGSHGYSGADRVLGTTAAKVVNHAARSVFVVRPRPQA